jgi:allantoicase
MMDLLSAGVGGRIVECNDEFFAEAANLIKEEPPVWREGLFTEQGKWMDGWETRRRREPGHDFCVLAMGIPGAIRKVTVDTSFFTGNYPESFSLEGCGAGTDDRLEDVEWVEMIPRTELQGDAVALFEIDDRRRVTHLRLNIFPDGGIARLRVEGDPIPAMDAVCPDGPVDLAAAALGGQALEASNAHYSVPSNMLKPVPSRGMWDGWETKRRRGPGHDWATFRLGLPGTVERVLVDTSFFRGNSPGWVSLDVSDDGLIWGRVFEEVAVKADTVNEIAVDGSWHASHVRLSIHPDGGVARLRVLGRPDLEAAGAIRVRYLNALFAEEARSFFRTACGATRWVDAMVEARPYETTSEVLEVAERAFDELEERDWLEAFAAHPRIGERGDAVASREQAGTESAGREVIRRLSDVNRAYEQRFGFIYIVYASGKSAEEMLEIAERRLEHAREAELRTAAGEQRKITATRLRRMMCQEAG